MASVTLEGVYKSFDDTQVVKGVDLEIADGEFIVLVGASGCGKSTVLRMVVGLESPTRGVIRIGGQDVTSLRPRERDIAMVFQSYALYPHMTVRQNMAFGLQVRGESAETINKAVSEAAELLGLSPLLDRKPVAMSGGQRQRVAMGRAIVRRPKAFLFDEPLSNLDAALRAQMRVELKKLHRRLGTTMIYVTHDQVEAMTLADRIVLLDKGRIAQVGPPRVLYEYPANRYTASFLGSPGMNFVDAQLAGPRITAPGIDVQIDPTAFPAASDGAVVLGLRPHDFEIEPTDTGSLEATVEVLEPMGWETHVHLSLPGQTWVVRFDASDAARLAPGETVKLGIRSECVRLFDPETEKALHNVPAEV